VQIFFEKKMKKNQINQQIFEFEVNKNFLFFKKKEKINHFNSLLLSVNHFMLLFALFF